MSTYDIIYIQGNPSSGTLLQHEQMNNSVLKLIENYTYKVIDSEDKNLSGKKIPEAKVYIGFSRGSRYLKKLPKTSLKISIGGIKGSRVHLFKNNSDHILLGDISMYALEDHFIISTEDKIKIKELITDFLG